MKFVLKSIKKDLGGTKLLIHFLDSRSNDNDLLRPFLAPSKYGSLKKASKNNE